MKYDVAEVNKIFKDHELTQFEVLNVTNLAINDTDNRILIMVEPKQRKNLSEYLLNRKFIKYLKFISGNETYEAISFFVKIDVGVKRMYVIKKGDLVVDVISYYEVNNSEKFADPYLNLSIDEVIKEEY